MYEDIVAKSQDQFAKLAAPVQKFNSLVVNHLEKLVEFQLDAARSYNELGLEQLRAALDISDAKALQSYVSGRQKVAEVVGQKISSDAGTLTELNKQFAAEVQKLAQENVAVLVPAAAPKAAPKTRAPARKSA